MYFSDILIQYIFSFVYNTYVFLNFVFNSKNMVVPCYVFIEYHYEKFDGGFSFNVLVVNF